MLRLLNMKLYIYCTAGIAGIMGMLVLQYLREFDAPALQRYKPLPFGTGS
jgi:hypothetical protein